MRTGTQGCGEGGGEDGDSAKAAKEDANPIVSPQVGLGGGAPNNIIRGGMENTCTEPTHVCM